MTFKDAFTEVIKGYDYSSGEGCLKMTIDEAIRILDKKTSATALREYDEIIRYTVVEEACKIACEAMMIYDRAIKDVVRLSTENSELKEEIGRLRAERGDIENVE